MPYDKKLHIICGFFITILIGLYSLPLGLYCGTVAGVAKEIYDQYDYGGFDVYDMLATWTGAAIGAILLYFLR